jgi:hypothetical protein
MHAHRQRHRAPLWAAAVAVAAALLTPSPAAGQHDTAASVRPPANDDTTKAEKVKVAPLKGDCAAVRARLPEMAANGIARAVCTDTVDPAAKAQKRGGPPRNDTYTTQSHTVVPSWCGTGGYIVYTRHQMCGVVGGNLMYVFDTQTGARLGEVHYNYIVYAFANSQYDVWGHEIEIHVTSSWGQVAGSTVSGYVDCDRACTVDTSSFPVQVADSAGDRAGGDGLLDSTVTSGIGYSKSAWHWQWCVPGASCTAHTNARLPLDIRCDNALPGVNYVGCVVPFHRSHMYYSLSGPYAELARHIRDAQNSGLPGRASGSGTPLTRLTDSQLQQANRATACPSSYPRPPGKSCDEYPFASTWQGAYTYGGGPRTHTWCLVVLLSQSTGPYGHSVCMINETHNSVGGAALGAFYRENRIIESDAFWVTITS